MACDICGAKGTSLNNLLDGYRTPEVRDICPKCERIVNDKVWAMRKVADGMVKTLVRRFITERAGAAGVPASRPCTYPNCTCKVNWDTWEGCEAGAKEPPAGGVQGMREHDLYTDADKDRPDVICDSNGQVVLALCKVCGRAESELDGPCPGARGVALGRTPDFDALRGKRMSELTPQQQDDARELWLREQIGWMMPYYKDHMEFLLKRLDAARGVPASDGETL